MDDTQTEFLEDGSVRVIVTLNGWSTSGVVSSAHLVEPKANQLRDYLVRMAKDLPSAFDDPLL